MAKSEELIAHPVADLFPMLPEDELQELVDSIVSRGLEHPIVLDKDGRILDGRNRYAACKIAGIEPRFVTYEGKDADGYALDTNIHRRHLRPGARHMVTEMARRRAGERNLSPSKKSVAEQAGIGRADLNNAAAVLDFAPDLVPDVLAGRMGLQAAADVAREKKRQQIDRERKEKRLKDAASDLYELVHDGRLNLDEALASLEQRLAKQREEDEQRKREEEEARNEAERLAAQEADQRRESAACYRDKIYSSVKYMSTLFQGVYTPEVVADHMREFPSFQSDVTAEDWERVAEIASEFAELARGK